MSESKVCHIVAADLNNNIGIDNTLPWHISEDLKYFKRVTKGHPVIMGRKTYESIGRLLPNRLNIILTRNKDYKIEGADIKSSIDEAIKAAKDNSDYDTSKVFIIGGAEIYKQSLDLVDEIYFTRVETKLEKADAAYPLIPDSYKLVSKESGHDKFDFTWEVYQK